MSFPEIFVNMAGNSSSDNECNMDFDVDGGAATSLVEGRGRGRGRGGSRGRSRGRGNDKRRGRGRGGVPRTVVPLLSDDSVTRLQALRQQRADLLRSSVSQLTAEQGQELLTQVIEVYPSLILDVMSQLANSAPPQPSSSPLSERPSWCVCSHCEQMPSLLEQLCCTMNADNCLSLLPDLEYVITDRTVLWVQMLHRRDVLAINALSEDDINRSYRHAAYRQFVWWSRGSLGQGRVVIPSCCVIKIRKTFPDSRGIYTGFLPHRLV